MTDEQKDEEAQSTEEVDEQAFRFKREDEPNEGSEDDSDEEGGSEVEEQARLSDVTLKHSIAPIAGVLAALR